MFLRAIPYTSSCDRQLRSNGKKVELRGMISRRDLLLTPAAAFLAPRIAERVVDAAPGKMSLALHQNTSSRAGFRASLEGWAKAGITQVELTSGLLDQFLKSDSVAAAKRLLSDLNLKPVSGS